MVRTEKPDQAALSDEEILVLSLKTPSLFAVLIGRYETAFLRKARGIVGNREEIQDIVVETFTKIYFKAGQFRKRPDASFRSWAYKILLNTSFSYYRRLKLDRKFALTAPDFNWSLVEAKGGERAIEDRRDLIASVLSRLPTQLARLLRLYFLEDRSQQEIAQSEGLTLPAVKTRIHRAKKLFKNYLKELA